MFWVDFDWSRKCEVCVGGRVDEVRKPPPASHDGPST